MKPRPQGWRTDMLRIRCPWCGLRDGVEFRYGGEASRHRPDDPASADDAEWADYLFYRENTRGPHRERWVHAWGCGQWFELERDTVSHRTPDTDGNADDASDKAEACPR